MQVELKSNADTPDASSVQKAADFVQAFLLGMALTHYVFSRASFGTLALQNAEAYHVSVQDHQHPVVTWP